MRVVKGFKPSLRCVTRSCCNFHCMIHFSHVVIYCFIELWDGHFSGKHENICARYMPKRHYLENCSLGHCRAKIRVVSFSKLNLPFDLEREGLLYATAASYQNISYQRFLQFHSKLSAY